MNKFDNLMCWESLPTELWIVLCISHWKHQNCKQVLCWNETTAWVSILCCLLRNTIDSRPPGELVQISVFYTVVNWVPQIWWGNNAFCGKLILQDTFCWSCGGKYVCCCGLCFSNHREKKKAKAHCNQFCFCQIVQNHHETGVVHLKMWMQNTRQGVFWCHCQVVNKGACFTMFLTRVGLLQIQLCVTLLVYRLLLNLWKPRGEPSSHRNTCAKHKNNPMELKVIWESGRNTSDRNTINWNAYEWNVQMFNFNKYLSIFLLLRITQMCPDFCTLKIATNLQIFAKCLFWTFSQKS